MSAAEPTTILLLSLIGTFLLRALGVVGAGRLEEDTPLFRWIGCVAFAIAAGLMGKILFLPSGVLAEAAISARLGGVAVGLFVFFAFGRQILWGLGAGLLAFLLIDLLPQHWLAGAGYIRLRAFQRHFECPLRVISRRDEGVCYMSAIGAIADENRQVSSGQLLARGGHTRANHQIGFVASLLRKFPSVGGGVCLRLAPKLRLSGKYRRKEAAHAQSKQ